MGDHLRSYAGIIITFISSVFFCLNNVIVKHLSHVDPFTISCLRFLTLGLLSTPVTALRSRTESPFPSGKRSILIIRSLLGATNLMIHFYSLQHLPLADCMMISSTSPMFTVFFARLFIKEPIMAVDIINVVLVFIGIILIVKPPFLFGDSMLSSTDPDALNAAIILVLASLFLQSNVYVTLRSLKDVHWSITCSVFGVIGFVECLIVAVFIGPTCLPDSATERALLYIIGMLSFVSQIGLVISAHFESAASVALLKKAFDVICAFIFQLLFFQEVPGWLSILGAVIILMAVMASGFKKMFLGLKEDNLLKQNKIMCILFSG